MGTASLHLDGWTLAWREFWEKVAPHCGDRDCSHTRGVWRRIRSKPRGILLEGSRYCIDECLARALGGVLQRSISRGPRPPAVHRIPLGLLLLSRQQLTEHQLRAALEAQRDAGCGRIGEWLQTLGFASEQQITAALARQWSCPVLRSSPLTLGSRTPQIPVTLLESFAMIPLGFVEATATLHVAFGEGIDYGVLYAIEQIVGCHTESCMAVPSFVRSNLQHLSRRRGESEIVFDRVADSAELSRIICSYCVRLAASEIRLATCGPHVWVRLFLRSRPPLDLVLRSPRPRFDPTAGPSGQTERTPLKSALPLPMSVYGG